VNLERTGHERPNDVLGRIRQPPAFLPTSPLEEADPLGLASLKMPGRITTRDPESARIEVARKLSAHSLSVTGAPAPFAAHLASGDAGAVRLLEIGYDADVRISRGTVDGYVGIVIPLTGWVQVRVADNMVVARPYQTMIVGNDQPVDIRWPSSARVVMARLDRAALSSALGILLPRMRQEPLRVASAAISGGEGFALYGAFQMIARAFNDFGSPEAVPATQSRLLAQQMLVTTLLTVPHSLSAPLHEPALPAPNARVQSALRLVAAEQFADRTILDLAAELGISLRALELGFRRELGTTPHEYLRTSRLGRVHEELARADAEHTTVSAIANKWGFAHHGRFARAYRELFGELPAQTLRS
jgi:AraC-like DNA-binding protein